MVDSLVLGTDLIMSYLLSTHGLEREHVDRRCGWGCSVMR